MTERLLWFPAAAGKAGASVVLVQGWETRANKRQLDIRWVIVHHCASVPWSTNETNVAVVVQGNSVAPGPICSICVLRDGRLAMVAAGASNNAGAGTLPDGRTDGNAQAGFEAVNAGAGMRWTPGSNEVIYGGSTFRLSVAQLATWTRRVAAEELVQDPRTGLWWEVWSEAMLVGYATGVALILDHEGLDTTRIVSHQQYAPTRKIDPAGPWFDEPTRPLNAAAWMVRFCGLVRLILDQLHGTPVPPVQPDPTPTIPPPTEELSDMNVIMRCEGHRPVHLIVEEGKVVATGLATDADIAWAVAAGAKDIPAPVSETMFLDWVTKALVSMGWGKVVNGTYVGN